MKGVYPNGSMEMGPHSGVQRPPSLSPAGIRSTILCNITTPSFPHRYQQKKTATIICIVFCQFPPHMFWICEMLCILLAQENLHWSFCNFQPRGPYFWTASGRRNAWIYTLICQHVIWHPTLPGDGLKLKWNLSRPLIPTGVLAGHALTTQCLYIQTTRGTNI